MVLIVLLPLAIASWRGWAAHKLLALTGACLVAGGTAVAILLAYGADRTAPYHDTYYVVTHFHWIANLALLFAVLTALAWLAHRFARPTLPRLQRVAVWCLALGLIVPAVLNASMFTPQANYLRIAEWLPTLKAIGWAGARLAAAGAFTLLALPLFALLFRRIR